VLACAVVTHVCQVRALFSLLRPPGFTLFPYTTLFRSILALGRVLREKRSEASSSTRRPAFARAPVRIFRAGKLEKGRNDVDHVPDRKSTRLNSSHVKTSYAVFCLKKKNTDRQQTGTTA